MKFRRKQTKGWRVLLILLCMSLIFPLTAYAETDTSGTEQETKTIRVAFPVQEGMSYFREDGTAAGYNYVYLEKVAEYTGWKMEYVPYDSADSNENIENALADLQAGKVDLLGPLLKTDQMEEMLAFPKQNYGTVYTTLCALESSNLREDNASLQKPLKVGLWDQAHTRNEEVLSYLDSENFEYEIHYYQTSDAQVDALEKGEVDVISNVSLYPIDGTRIIEKFAPRPYYFASSKENTELIQELDEAISTLNQVQPSLQDVLFERYFHNTRYLFTPDEEQMAYLKTLGTLQVLCVDHVAPYAYQRDGSPAGILVSVLQDFAKEADVSVEFHFCESQTEAEKLMEQNRYDFLIGLPLDSDYCAGIGFVRSKSLMETSLVCAHDANKENCESVAVKQGLVDQADLSAYEEIVIFDSVEECIQAVNNGEADGLIGDRSEVEYYIYDTGSPLVISQISGDPKTICLAINRDNDLQFIRLVNDYIYSLSDMQISSYIEDGNMHSSHMSLQSYIRLHPIQTTFIVSGIVAVVVIACFMMFHARRMREKNKELLAANLAKSEFLTRMSHDIRTPMNGIIGLLDISDKFIEDPEAVQTYHKKIREASEYLLSLINDVLDMSKLDAGDLHFSRDSVYLEQVMESCCGILEARARERGITLYTPGIDKLSLPRIITSELHFRQVLMNIVSNAIKYNKHHGSVTVTTDVLEQTADMITCRFTVADTGIGMSEKFQKQMFEPFAQENGENRSEFKGTGLGLSIVKSIIDKMGGKIHVESVQGAGTRFEWTLTFPVDKEYQPGTKEKESFAEDLSGIRVLAAEDNALNAEILLFVLHDLGAEVLLVDNGKQAVDAFETSRPGQYDVILMDIMMPVMDGYTASRTIRRMKREDAQKIPIIALTANAFAEDVARAADAGMDAHIAKKLKNCILQKLSERQHEADGKFSQQIWK